MTSSGYAYLASAGETFDIISLRIYGDEKYAPQIMEFNPSLCGKSVFAGGERVELPAVDGDEIKARTVSRYPSADAPWKE